MLDLIALHRYSGTITQEHLAEKVGVSQSVVSRWISGNKQPSLEQLAALAIALNTTTDELLGLGDRASDYKENVQKMKVTLTRLNIEHGKKINQQVAIMILKEVWK